FAIASSNLAGICKEEGNLTTAVAYYREAIRLCPEFADAHSNLGNVLKERGLVHDAMLCYQTAIKLRPDFAIAYGNLTSCYCDCDVGTWPSRRSGTQSSRTSRTRTTTSATPSESLASWRCGAPGVISLCIYGKWGRKTFIGTICFYWRVVCRWVYILYIGWFCQKVQ
ncbi:unnamed protein product, partial [Ectocarpus sp. 12 AP-2014]